MIQHKTAESCVSSGADPITAHSRLPENLVSIEHKPAEPCVSGADSTTAVSSVVFGRLTNVTKH